MVINCLRNTLYHVVSLAGRYLSVFYENSFNKYFVYSIMKYDKAKDILSHGNYP